MLFAAKDIALTMPHVYCMRYLVAGVVAVSTYPQISDLAGLLRFCLVCHQPRLHIAFPQKIHDMRCARDCKHLTCCIDMWHVLLVVIVYWCVSKARQSVGEDRTVVAEASLLERDVAT